MNARTAFTAFALGCVCTLAPSWGALIERDLFEHGDGLLTRDTDTNLEWLDLTESLGHAHGFLTQQQQDLEFRIAEGGEIFPFLSNVGIDTGTSGAHNMAPMMQLISLVGTTYPDQPELPSINAVWRNGNPFSGITLMHMNASTGSIFSDTFVHATTSHPNNAKWLVRDIPAPGALTLGGMAMLMTRRSRRAR